MSFQTPTFFAWDGLQTYPDGEITSLGNEYVWALAGNFTLVSVVMGLDNLDDYPNGDLTSFTLGTFWTEAGTVTLVT